MSKQSAGLLLFRKRTALEVMLVHPGGPFWKNKDLGAWSIPKGEFTDNEDALATAIRELKEETGLETVGPFTPLKPIKQKGGKLVYAWAVNKDADVSNVKSNEFEMKWPPRSGKKSIFPEVDRAAWFDINTAKTKINTAQVAFLDQLQEMN